jgi:2-dehydro-3-deoxyphosphogalactonate aldolase
MTLNFQKTFQALGLIGIFRGITPAEVEAVVMAAVDSGLRIVEVPLNSPQALHSIEKLAKRFGEQIIIGAGTVITVADVDAVARSGGRLVVTPYARSEVVEKAKTLGLVAVPGAMTPTEVFAMHHCGADAVKIFPAEIMSPQGLKALRVVVPDDLLLIPVGGVGLENMVDYLAAGADGFGLGSAIYRPGDDIDSVARNTTEFVRFMKKMKPIIDQ